MIIQACQSTEIQRETPDNDIDMAMRNSPEANSHITLERPHTVLLNATLRGGYATRGAYTKALSDALKLADGSHDIHTLHCMAQSIMGDHQTPEFRSSLKKRLYLNSKGVLFYS